jgi:glycosyltransferase involved in cell wall biosynthesis
MKRKLRFAKETSQHMAQQLQEIWDSPNWQLLNWLHHNRVLRGIWRIVKRCSPTGTKEFVKRLLRRSARSSNGSPRETGFKQDSRSKHQEPNGITSLDGKAEIIEELQTFIERVDNSSVRDLVVFFAGVKFIESEGQRVTQIIRELIANGVPVLLLYFRWSNEYNQPVPRSHDPLFFQIPLDLFEPQRQLVIDYPFRSSLRRSCVFEFPHPLAFQWVNEFNLAGWKTVYDIIDDWEEFHAANKAVWYEPAVEQYLCANASAVTAIVPLLAKKAKRWVEGLDVKLVPNGVSLNSFDMTLPPKDLPRGKITVGYFGYLTPAWFDWQMVADIAARRRDWQFHIIGYGDPIPVELTQNVHLLGKVPHHHLYSYTQCWDVAIVPFIPSTLSQGADPIKVYEYLTLGLPVVTTNIPHLRDYPGVYVADSAEEFDQLLETAATAPLDQKVIRAFLEKCTWYQRGLQLIEAGQDSDHVAGAASYLTTGGHA